MLRLKPKACNGPNRMQPNAPGKSPTPFRGYAILALSVMSHIDKAVRVRVEPVARIILTRIAIAVTQAAFSPALVCGRIFLQTTAIKNYQGTLFPT
tara:strand:- start:76452 stop:76739 length:288 start_codon:yes stop_codon:yes gene_type:complete